MANTAAVEHFLRYGMGYEEIARFNLEVYEDRSKKPVRTRLQGKILGTIRTSSTKNMRLAERGWNMKFPFFPKIQPISEIAQTESKSWVIGERAAQSKDFSKFPYYLASGLLLNGITGRETRSLIEEHVLAAFPETDVQYSYTGKFSVTLDLPDLVLRAGGLAGRKESKYFVAGFNTRHETAEWINEVISAYTGIMQGVKNKSDKTS